MFAYDIVQKQASSIKKLPIKMIDSCSIFLVSNEGIMSRHPVSYLPGTLNVVSSYCCDTNRRSEDLAKRMAPIHLANAATRLLLGSQAR
jgi:hypothetical protein